MKYIVEIDENIMSDFVNMRWNSELLKDEIIDILGSVEDSKLFDEEEYIQEFPEQKLIDELQRRKNYREEVKRNRVEVLESQIEKLNSELRQLQGEEDNNDR